MLKRIKNYWIAYFIDRLTTKLLKAVSEKDILTMSSEGYLYHSRKLSQEEIAELKDEARMLKDSFLWKLMVKEVEYMAYMRMTYHAKMTDGINDIIFGKALFYSVDLMRKFLKNLST